MKIISIDNFDREIYDDVLICENIKSKSVGKVMVDALNEAFSGPNEDRHFRLVEDDHKLFVFKPYPQYENYKITKITPTTNIQAIRTSNNSLFEEWILVFTEEVHYSNNTNGDYFIKYVEHEFKLDNPSNAFIILLEQYNKIQNYLLSIISK